uniref:ATP-dependent DNA helicase n=1 Tax=Cajanus cajan TaxID=3821 RepID=A0A151U471_CAJCA|nr:ATP-dependent DNA helicase PIF1 [Cajanus cajan]
MWKTLTSILHSKGHFVLTMASSGITYLLLIGGLITQSKFAIPIPTLQNLTSNIHQGIELVELLKTTQLIIWDETPMVHIFFINSANDDYVGIKFHHEFLITNFNDLAYVIVQNTSNYSIIPKHIKNIRASNHRIKLKSETPIILLRNLDQSEGLRNGTRLIVTKLANHVIEAKIISREKNFGNLIYIPRMFLSLSRSPWPFKLIRRQFPLIVSYVMIINKSQGQSLYNIRLYLPRLVFSHGQLYVTFLRVQNKKGLKILIHGKGGKPLSTTTTVVFKEVFQNLW